MIFVDFALYFLKKNTVDGYNVFSQGKTGKKFTDYASASHPCMQKALFPSLFFLAQHALYLKGFINDLF